MSLKLRKRQISKRLVMANHTHTRWHHITYLSFAKPPKNKVEQHGQPAPNVGPSPDQQRRHNRAVLGHTGSPAAATDSHHPAPAPAVYTLTVRWSLAEDGGDCRSTVIGNRLRLAAPWEPACSSPGLATPLLASTSAQGPRLHQGDGERPCHPGERVALPRAVSGPLRASHWGGVWQPHRWRVLHAQCCTIQIGEHSALYWQPMYLRWNMLWSCLWRLKDPHAARSHFRYQIDPRLIVIFVEM